MRSFLLVIGTLVVLIGGFAAYWFLQPPSRAGQNIAKEHVDVPPLKQGDSHNRLRPGSNAWFMEFDAVTGDLVRKFRATEYLPQNNGTILVKKPEVWFYSPNHQQVHLSGVDGEIVMKDMPDLSVDSSLPHDKAPPAPPSRGRINHVTIDMIDPNPRNNLVMTTNNVQFDNDTLLITTESYVDEKGNVVPADQVPVHVEGNYKFDGLGLSMRWNDKDGRLEMLEIAHGKQLEIDDASGFSGFSPGVGVPTTRRSAMLMLPIAIASTDARSAGDAIKASKNSGARSSTAKQRTNKPPRAPAVPTPYLATFNDNVTITQGNLSTVVGDRMEVQFMTKQEAAKSATQPMEPSQQVEQTPTAADASPSSAATPATAPTSQTLPATQPATRPAEPPVIIRWTGKLTIVPTPANKRMSVPGGSAIVSLFGKPVRIIRTNPGSGERDDIQAASVVYHTFDRSATLLNSPELPLVVLKKFAAGKTEPSSTITTGSIDYVAAQRLATLTGPGTVFAPADETAPDKGNLDVKWQRGARIHLADSGSQEQMSVRQMDLSGNVDVKHPQLALRSQELSLFFTPQSVAGAKHAIANVEESTKPSTRPTGSPRSQMQLDRVLATTGVWCQLTDAQGKKQTVEGDSLELLTAPSANHQFQPRQVNAAGSVHAYDGQQDLHAGRVELTLKPATNKEPKTKKPTTALAATQPATHPSDQPQVELERMYATDHVIVNRADGSVVTGDQLEVTTPNDQTHIRLVGAPDAQVIDAKKNVMTGPLMEFDPKEQTGHVIGEGSLHMMPQPGQGTAPADVSWKHRADMYGAKNIIDADGSIAFSTIDRDGAKIVGSGDRVHIDLQEKPVPATQTSRKQGSGADNRARPAATSKPATRETIASGAMSDAMKMDTMGSKELKAVTLDGSARVVSTRTAPDGSLLRQLELKGPKVIYRIAGSESQPAHSVLVPAAGQMLVRDYMPTTTRPSKDNGSGIEGGRGDTAFAWQDHMLYSEADHQAVMVGSVRIVYMAQGPNVEPVRIDADKVTANFEPTAKPATRASRPATNATNPAGQESALHLKNVMADGRVRVRRGGSELLADHIDYDPVTHWMTARGTPDHPAVFNAADPSQSATGEVLEWNTQTWNIRTRNTSIQSKTR